jgi:hypothetical protein
LKKSKVTKKYEGKYNDKKCSSKNEAGEGKYELKEGVGKGKTLKAKGGGANLEVPGVGGVSCTKSSATGKFTSPKTAGDILVTFTGCEISRIKCETTATEGEIKTNALKGSVGYLNAPTIHCQDLLLNVTGSVVGEVVPTRAA